LDVRPIRSIRTGLAWPLAGLLLLAACSPPADEELEPPDDPEEELEEEADPGTEDLTDPDAPEAEPDPDPEAGDGPTLTLLTHDSFDISEEVMVAFTERTGIGVRVQPLGDAGTALNQTILTQDNPQGDLLFGVDNTFLTRAFEVELFTPYESDALDAVPERFQLDDEHRVTPVDYGDVCLNYDVAWFEDNDVPLPEDLADLTDEVYDGLLTVTNPATSSPGMAFLLATIERFGEDGYLGYWEALLDNDVLVTEGWSQAYYEEFSATGGERPLVLSYASSPPAEVYFAEEELDEAPTGVITESCFRQIEFVGILATTEFEQEAQQLVDFLLSETFQEDIPLRMFVFPVNEDAELPELFEEHAVVPDEPFELDPETIGEHRDDWIAAWTETVLR
jgi:thiamine transport system substrate-binding protein